MLLYQRSRPAGLSPRVRGNRNPVVEGLRRRGSIPACAGEPASGGRAVPKPAVYPRVCGGTLQLGDVPGQGIGLSPRVRGNPPPPPGAAGRERSIPACAGEPPGCAPTGVPSQVYPRVCGGTPPVIPVRDAINGLSPRVRGNHASQSRCPGRPGSIPACAGEPRRSLMMPSIAAVYPRVCGGTASRTAARASEKGLSPRVRGNLTRAAIRSCR